MAMTSTNTVDDVYCSTMTNQVCFNRGRDSNTSRWGGSADDVLIDSRGCCLRKYGNCVEN